MLRRYSIIVAASALIVACVILIRWNHTNERFRDQSRAVETASVDTSRVVVPNEDDHYSSTSRAQTQAQTIAAAPLDDTDDTNFVTREIPHLNVKITVPADWIVEEDESYRGPAIVARSPDYHSLSFSELHPDFTGETIPLGASRSRLVKGAYLLILPANPVDEKLWNPLFDGTLKAYQFSFQDEFDGFEGNAFELYTVHKAVDGTIEQYRALFYYAEFSDWYQSVLDKFVDGFEIRT